MSCTLMQGPGNQLQFVRVVQKGQVGNKIIAPANLKPRPVAPKPGNSFILPAGTSAADMASIQNTTGLGNVVVLPNYLVRKFFVCISTLKINYSLLIFS